MIGQGQRKNDVLAALSCEATIRDMFVYRNCSVTIHLPVRDALIIDMTEVLAWHV